MKRIIIFLFLVSGIIHGQVVNIPDANFKNALVNGAPVDTNGDSIPDSDVDTNNNGEIDFDEALAANNLSLNSLLISDFTGIESFTNLVTLFCNNNQLTTINLSSLGNLNTLSCSGNQLTSLSLGLLTSLKFLDCSNNQLTILNLVANNSLLELYCNINPGLSQLNTSNLVNLLTLESESCQITSLNLSNNNSLKILKCGNNQLTSLSISNLINLTTLKYQNNNIPNLNFSNLLNLKVLNLINTGTDILNVSGLNQLTSLACNQNEIALLDLTNSINLQELICRNISLPILDVSNCINLQTLECGGSALIQIFMKNGKNEFLSLWPSLNLEFVCVDESQLQLIGPNIISSNPNTVFHTYCTFIPGGNFNTIKGSSLYDVNNDGCDFDIDFSSKNLKLYLTNENSSESTFVNNASNYEFFTGTGNYILLPELEQPDYFTVSPLSAEINFPLLNNVTQVQNFCISPNGIHPDLEVVIFPDNEAKPGFNARYKIVFKNKGNQTFSGNIKLNFDSSSMFFVASEPEFFIIDPDVITWNYTELKPFETRVINLTLSINESPTVNLDDVLNFETTINPVELDEIQTDNSFKLKQKVVNFYESNKIECLQGNVIAPDNIGKYIHYNINFDNIGTSEVTNIVIKDTINTLKFDVKSLQLLFASQPVETKIKNNIVEFIFKNINLPTKINNPIGGHGNVLFKIKTLSTLQTGDEVFTNAHIYFDYKKPFITNEERTVFESLKNANFIKDKSITVYPNPTTSRITIKANHNILSVQLFDVQGRILETVSNNTRLLYFDLSNKSKGVYFIKITTKKGGKVEKLIKE